MTVYCEDLPCELEPEKLSTLPYTFAKGVLIYTALLRTVRVCGRDIASYTSLVRPLKLLLNLTGYQTENVV